MTTSAPTTLDFRKAHGTSNDFVLVDDRNDALDLPSALVVALCDRRRGIGGDGLIRLGAPRHPDAHVFMDYRNADGSVVEMCGNGVRVVADQWVRHVDASATRVLVDTRAGVRAVEVLRDPDGTCRYRVDMGPPVLDPEAIPYRPTRAGAPVETLAVDGTEVAVSAVGMGNPHAVIRVPAVATAPVTTLGPLVEAHDRFPARANVSFAAVRDRASVDLRVWERGVGETAACGTGACATVVALQRLGAVDADVAVHLPGGRLDIHSDGDTVLMTGPAVEVAAGTVDIAALTCTETRS